MVYGGRPPHYSVHLVGACPRPLAVWHDARTLAHRGALIARRLDSASRGLHREHAQRAPRGVTPAGSFWPAHTGLVGSGRRRKALSFNPEPRRLVPPAPSLFPLTPGATGVPGDLLWPCGWPATRVAARMTRGWCVPRCPEKGVCEPPNATGSHCRHTERTCSKLHMGRRGESGAVCLCARFDVFAGKAGVGWRRKRPEPQAQA